jgi:hypothetical protein
MQLEEIHERIVKLHGDLRTRRLDNLASYVAALRERIEERLA